MFFRAIASFFTRRPIVTVATHDGSFHTDDVCSAVILKLWLRDVQNRRMQVVRTRDEAVLAQAEYVFDVGGVYDHALRRYDHHQKEGAGARSSGVPYASCGLVWKHYGMDLCDNNPLIYEYIDRVFIQPIDAHDCGFTTYTLTPPYGCAPYTIQRILSGLFRGDFDSAVLFLEAIFISLMREAKEIDSYAVHMRESLARGTDPRVLLLTQSVQRFTILSALSYGGEDFAGVEFLVFPSTSSDEGGEKQRDQREENKTKWNLMTLQRREGDFTPKRELPKAWWGLNADELARVTGVSDVIMCHRTGFLIKAKSKEGIEALLKQALENELPK